MLTMQLLRKLTYSQVPESSFPTQGTVVASCIADQTILNSPLATCPHRWIHNLSHLFITTTTWVLIIKCGLVTWLRLFLALDYSLNVPHISIAPFDTALSLLTKKRTLYLSTKQKKHVNRQDDLSILIYQKASDHTDLQSPV